MKRLYDRHETKNQHSVYAINGALAILLGLTIFCGTLIEVFQLPQESIFSIGNMLLAIIFLFVVGILVSWINPKLSGILLVTFGIATICYLIFTSTTASIWIIAGLIVSPFFAIGLHLILKQRKNELN